MSGRRRRRCRTASSSRTSARQDDHARDEGRQAHREVTGGTYTITVVDKSKTHSFHLSGPGVNKKTGTKFTGKVTWKVTLKTASVYRYWSDASPTLGSTLTTS